MLLDNKGTAKLSDFGLAAINSSVARSTNAPVRNQVGLWNFFETGGGGGAWDVVEHDIGVDDFLGF